MIEMWDEINGLASESLRGKLRERTQSLPYLISIRRMRELAAIRTRTVTISSPGIEIHAGVGSATTANGPSDKGTGTSEFK